MAAEFVVPITMKDGISDPAAAAARKILVLDNAIQATGDALTKAMAQGNVKQVTNLSKQMAAYESTLATIPAEERALADSHNALIASQKEVGKTAESASMTYSILWAEAIKKVAGIAWDALKGFGALILKGAELAISASSQKQAMLSYFDAMGQGVVTGKQTEDMIDGLKAKIGISKDSLVGWTKQLQAMGMVDLDEIEKNLTAVASSTALMGEAGGQAFTDITKKIQLAVNSTGKLEGGKKIWKSLADTGANVVDVAQEMGMSVDKFKAALDGGTINAAKFGDALQNALIKKGAGPLQKMANSLPNLKKLLEESIGDIFEDIDVGPFLAQVKSLFEIFGQATPSGNALKSGIGGAFQGMFDIATKVVPYVKHFLLDVVILGLKAYIGLKPLIKWFKELGDNAPFMALLKDSLAGIGKSILITTAAAVGLVVLFGALVAGAAAIGGAIAGALQAVVQFGVNVVAAVAGWIASAVSFGASFVDGLIQGITSGATKLVDSVKNLASSAANSFKSALGIASPSKVMAGYGLNVAQGAAQGIDAGATNVEQASSGLAMASAGGFTQGASEGAQAQSGGKGSGAAINVTASFTFGGGVTGASELTEQAVSLIFERLAAESGL